MAANPVVIGAVALASAGAGLGGFAAARAVGDGGDPVPTVAMYACPEPGAPAIGAANPGDRVWVVGRTGDRWAVVRLPDDPTRTAWLPLASVAVDGDASLLPELRCTSPDDAPEASASTSTPPATTAPPSTSGAPTSAPASTAPPTTPAVSDPAATTTTTAATTTTAVSTTASPTTTLAAATTTASPTTVATTVTTAVVTTAVTTTTVPPDTMPPGATLTPDRTTFYDVNGDPGCVDVVLVSVTPTDDRPGAVVTGVAARWAGQAGPAELALVPDGGRYRLEVFSNPPATSAVVTITASVRDAAGNVGAGSTQVTLLNAGSNGCVVG